MEEVYISCSFEIRNLLERGKKITLEYTIIMVDNYGFISSAYTHNNKKRLLTY